MGKLNIYFIERNIGTYIEYDENIDCVVIARNEADALELAFHSGDGGDECCDWGKENFTLDDFKKNISIEHIGISNANQKAGVVTINNKGS